MFQERDTNRISRNFQVKHEMFFTKHFEKRIYLGTKNWSKEGKLELMKQQVEQSEKIFYLGWIATSSSKALRVVKLVETYTAQL
ncbi:CLUMA_CG002960, isoform A [Clunio marinus]|uniref:CLUMA_CG002960, isoform A n=1 Tax=Clunio marinus TaxID=568069 RepID=A0A1J1HMA6_9DIPT|nr:CLUMA_CG002960, isoform A [Clunio marinus]